MIFYCFYYKFSQVWLLKGDIQCKNAYKQKFVLVYKYYYTSV